MVLDGWCYVHSDVLLHYEYDYKPMLLVQCTLEALVKGITRCCVTNEQTDSSSIISTQHNKKERGDVSTYKYSHSGYHNIVYSKL